METFEVVVEVTGSAYFDVEAGSADEAMTAAAAEWEAHVSDVQTQRLTGVGIVSDGYATIEPV